MIWDVVGKNVTLGWKSVGWSMGGVGRERIRGGLDKNIFYLFIKYFYNKNNKIE